MDFDRKRQPNHELTKHRERCVTSGICGPLKDGHCVYCDATPEERRRWPRVLGHGEPHACMCYGGCGATTTLTTAWCADCLVEHGNEQRRAWDRAKRRPPPPPKPPKLISPRRAASPGAPRTAPDEERR